MLRLLLFDLARALRPGAATLGHAHVRGLGLVPAALRADLGLGGSLLLTRAIDRADRQIEDRQNRDASRLLAILCDLASRRGFGPLEWDEAGG